MLALPRLSGRPPVFPFPPLGIIDSSKKPLRFVTLLRPQAAAACSYTANVLVAKTATISCVTFPAAPWELYLHLKTAAAFRRQFRTQ